MVLSKDMWLIHGTIMQVLERGKKEILGQHSDSRAWKEEVASDSEAFVCLDKYLSSGWV